MLRHFFLISFISSGLALLGLSVSDSVASFSCLKQTYPDFVLIKAFDITGSVDSNAIGNIKAAKAAGYNDIELLFDPSVLTGDAKGQVYNFMNTFAGQPYGLIWIMVQVGSWNPDQASNISFLSSLQEAFILSTPQPQIGISTTKDDWEALIGANVTSYSHLPLRYSDNTNAQNFSSFVSFGGWTTPSVKRYSQSNTTCGYSVVQNYKQTSSSQGLLLIETQGLISYY